MSVTLHTGPRPTSPPGYETRTYDLANLNARARAADDAPDFSERIRAGLTGFDAPLQR
jgi:hypothetical protein